MFDRKAVRMIVWCSVAALVLCLSGCGPTPERTDIRFSQREGYRWKVPVAGAGKSSPVVWENYILLTSAIDDHSANIDHDSADLPDADADDQGSMPMLVVLCYDRRDGSLLWQAPAGRAKGRTHAKNGYASASVATDGQRIYAFFGATGLFCFDFSGKRLWRAELGPIDHKWGTASSPILFENTVIQVCDYEGDSFIAAFDKYTGQVVWKTPRPSQDGWSTPVIVHFQRDGQPCVELVVNGTTAGPDGHGLIIAYDPRDGRELWRVRGTKTFVSPTPLVHNGLVYCMSGRNGKILCIRPGGSGDVTDTHVVWQHPRGGPYIPSATIDGGRLYVLTDGGYLTCYDAQDGKMIFTGRLPGAYTASLVAAGGRIYAVSETGTVSVLASDVTFRLLAQSRLHTGCWATPAVVDGDLILRTEDALYCIPWQADGAPLPGQTNIRQGPAQPPQLSGAGHSSGQDSAGQSSETPKPINKAAAERPGQSWPIFRGDPQATGVARAKVADNLEPVWTFTVDKGGVEATPIIADGKVFIGDSDSKFYALALADGKKLWEFSAPGGFVAPAGYRQGRVFVGDVEGNFYCLDANSGKQLWKFTTKGEIDSGPNFYKDRVLFGSQDNNLYCLETESGQLVWKYETSNQIRCSPTVADGHALVAGCDGNLHIIDLETGRSVGEVPMGGPTMCTPAVAGQRAFVGTEDGVFMAVDIQEKKPLWKFQNPQHAGAFRASAAVTPGAVVVASRDRHVHALNPQTGEPLWSFSAKARVDCSPVVVGELVFVGAANGRLFGLEVKTGKLRWEYEAGGAIVGSPAAAAERLVIGTDAGQLLCFGTK